MQRWIIVAQRKHDGKLAEKGRKPNEKARRIVRARPRAVACRIRACVRDLGIGNYAVVKRLISILVSLGILALIYWKIDGRRLWGVFAQWRSSAWMAVSLAMVVPRHAVDVAEGEWLMPGRAAASGSARPIS